MTTNKGKLIVFEGLDGCGKLTQHSILKKRLEDKGHDVVTFDFPQYDSFFGELVAKYLRGEFGKKEELTPEIPVILFALDRYNVKHKIKESLEEGKIVLMNRYKTSNLGFHGAKFKDKERWEFINWLDQLEARMPDPDLVIFLDVPRGFAKELVKKGSRDLRNYLDGKEDIHEADDPYQLEVEELYRELTKKRKEWEMINCIKGNKLMSIEEVSEKVWMAVKNLLK